LEEAVSQYEARAGRYWKLHVSEVDAGARGRGTAGDPEAVRAEARDLVEHWSTAEGGFIVFNYGDSESIGVSDGIAEVMFETFYDLREYWT
jgi:hypothetical protein